MLTQNNIVYSIVLSLLFKTNGLEPDHLTSLMLLQIVAYNLFSKCTTQL